MRLLSLITALAVASTAYSAAHSTASSSDPSPSSTDSPSPSDSSSSSDSSDPSSSSSPSSTSCSKGCNTNSPAYLSRMLLTAPNQQERIKILVDNGGNSSFVFNFTDPSSAGNLTGPGGDVVPSFGSFFPAVEGLGISMAVFNLNPCGIVPPHLHPRAHEQIIVSNGTVFTQFITEAGSELITNTLSLLEGTVFPMGSIHLEFNPTCENSQFISAFNSDDPGISVVAGEFFSMDQQSIVAALGNVPAIGGADISSVEKGLPAGAVAQVKQCLSKCGIKQNSKRSLREVFGI